MEKYIDTHKPLKYSERNYAYLPTSVRHRILGKAIAQNGYAKILQVLNNSQKRKTISESEKKVLNTDHNWVNKNYGSKAIKSKSPSKRRSKSPSKRRSRSRSKSPSKRRSRSRSKSPSKRRSRSKSPSKRRSRSRSKSPSRTVKWPQILSGKLNQFRPANVDPKIKYTDLGSITRHKMIKSAVKTYGYKHTLGLLNGPRVLLSNKSPDRSKVFAQDVEWLKKQYK